MIRMLLADDRPTACQGTKWATILARRSSGRPARGEETVRLEREVQPDVFPEDISTRRLTGIEVANVSRGEVPALRLMLRLPVDGYLNRRATAGLIVTHPALRFHLHNLFANLNVSRRIQFVTVARERDVRSIHRNSPKR